MYNIIMGCENRECYLHTYKIDGKNNCRAAITVNTEANYLLANKLWGNIARFKGLTIKEAKMNQARSFILNVSSDLVNCRTNDYILKNAIDKYKKAAGI